MTPEQLVEKMAKACLIPEAHSNDVQVFNGIAKVMLRIVLQAIEDGEVVTTEYAGVDEDNTPHERAVLNPDFAKFLKEK